MRWRDEPAPKWGDWREREAFLILPRTIGGETRWLEWGEWEQRYSQPYDGDSDWVDVRWSA